MVAAASRAGRRVELASPTAWSPRSKPIWLTDVGCPAVDKGANQPSVFPDPKSSENFKPYFSNGGQFLATVLGTSAPTPAAVQAALPSADPARLAEAEARWLETIRAEAETQRTAISETQATIRAEIASDDPVQKWWRPLYAFELTAECAALWTVLLHEFWTGDVQTINALISATALLVTYWGFRFGVLGVYITGRTREKVSAATGQDAPGLIDKLARVVAPKVVLNKK